VTNETTGTKRVEIEYMELHVLLILETSVAPKTAMYALYTHKDICRNILNYS
jgi:hypothetical protein